MDEIINPYIAGAPVTEKRMFFGREDVFNWIERSLSGQYADHILVVHGQRRVGKTSVLKQLSNRLPKRYIPIFFDLQGRTHTTLDRFLWWLAREIVRVLKQYRDVSITPPDKDLFTQDIEYFETRFLPDLKPVLGDDSILLLTFDEFDNLEESEVKETLAQPLIDHLRRMMGNPNVNFIFSIGSSGRKLENMQANYTEFFKTALYRKISFLTRDDAHRLITMPVQGTIEYDKDAVQYIFEIASGHPYFTQLICHELFSQCQKTGGRTVTLKDVESVLDDVVERGTVNLKFVWDEAADLEKWSLACLAQLEGKRDTRAVTDYLTHQHVRFNQQALDSALLHLREKDVLTDDHRFVNQLLQIWLKKNRPIEQVREELTEVNPIANRYIEIGLEFKNSRQYQKAIDSFQEALDIDADNLQAQVSIALTHLDHKNVERAILEFEKALTIDEEDIVSRAGLCDAYLAQGDQARERGRPRDAILAYQKVLDINAEHTEARGRMAEINRQRAEKALEDGRDEEALNAFAEALNFTPEDPALIERVEKVRAEKKAKVLAAQIARSEKEAGAGNWDKAVAALNEALAVSPGDESILKRIASTKERQKKERLDAILAKVNQAEKSSRWDAAIAALNEYLSLQPDDAAIQKRLTDLIAAKHAAWLNAIITRADQAVSYQNWDDALAVVNEVLAIEPDNTEIKSKAAKILAAKRVSELNAMLKRVEQAAQAGRWDETIDILNGGLASEPGNETLQAKLAEVRNAKREARHKAALRLADTAAQAGKWSTAIEALNEVLANEPDNAEYQKKLAEIRRLERESKLASLQAQARSFAKAEKFEDALAAWNEYLALEPDDRERALAEIESVKKAQGLARAYDEAYKAYSRKNYEKAISLFKGIVVEDTDYKDATRLLAEAIELRRTQRKWWQSKWLWGGVGGLVVLAVGWFALQPGSPLMNALLATSTAAPIRTDTPATTEVNVSPATKAIAPPPTIMPTPLPLAWARLSSGQFLSRDQVRTVVIDPNDPGVMYVGTENAGIYKSIDGGLSWQPIQSTEIMSEIQQSLKDARGKGDFSVTNTALDATKRIYRLDGSRWLISEDDGQAWREFSTTGYPISFMITFDQPGNVYIYHQTNLLKFSPDGRELTTLGNPGVGQVITTLVISQTDPNTMYAAGNGLAVSKDGGLTWTRLNNGIGSGVLQLDTASGDMPILYLQSGECKDAHDPEHRAFQDDAGQPLYLSTNGGQSWELSLQTGCYLIKDVDASTLYRIGQEAVWSADGNHMLGWLWQSRNQGNTWQTEYVVDVSIPFTVVAHPVESGILYAYSSESFDSAKKTGGGEKKIISDDYGNNWKNVDAAGDTKSCYGSAPQFIDVYRPMAIDPFDGNHVLFIDNGQLQESSNSCDTTSAFATVPNTSMNSIAFDPNNPGRLYAGTDGGAYVSFDGGKTWGQVNDGLLGATVVYSIAVDKDSNVYAATPYGVFKLEGK